MQSENTPELITQLTSQMRLTTTTGQRSSSVAAADDFTQEERDATAYFFMRMRNMWPSKFRVAYPTEEALSMAKRDWARAIGKHTREEIDAMFEFVRQCVLNGDPDSLYDWPEVGKILGTTGESMEHKNHAIRAAETDRMLTQHRLALTDQGKRERAVSARNAHINQLRSMLNIIEAQGDL